MSKSRCSPAALVALFTLFAASFLHAAPIDSTLYTTYSLRTGNTYVSYSVCGSTQQSEGCYGGGNLGPFGKIGALLEGAPSTNLKTSTVTRLIYVLDVAAGSGGNEVVLNVYKKTDTISPTFDTVVVTLSKTVTLALTGGSTALASMAANNGFIFLGTDQTPFAIRLQRNNYAMTQFGGFSPPLNVTAITSNKYGYIAVTFGNHAGSGFPNATIWFGPDGAGRGDGGGAYYMLEGSQALLPSTLP
jgi:hypothetical protein